MLNLELMTEKDRIEAAKLEKRRLYEEERKKRIFNPKQRLIGIDIAALENQIQDNVKRREESKRMDQLLSEQLKKADEVAVAMDRKNKQERHNIEVEISKFRQHFQRPEDRREYDLNDPHYIKKQLPVRINDDDPRLGPSSVQKFEGEDISYERRSKVQREQIKAWLDQQIMEKKQADMERQTAMDAFKAAIIVRDQRAIELGELEKDCRRKLEIANQRFNKALSEERKIQEANLIRQTKEDNLAELYNAMTSDLLTENPDVSKSNMGPDRKIPGLCKGMTEEEKAKFREDLQKQIKENEKIKDIKKRMDKEFEECFLESLKTIHLMDKYINIDKKKQINQLTEENKKLAEEQRKRQEYLNKVVYINTPSEAYYDQFNTTTR